MQVLCLQAVREEGEGACFYRYLGPRGMQEKV